MSAPPRTLAAWLAHLENAHPRKIDLGLDRVRAVLRALDPAISGVPVITVAGTNGKGSTVALLDAIYRAAGYRTGAYTSPHLLAYNERIRVGGVPAADADIVAAFDRIEAARGPVSLSYFEFGTLAALECFARAGCAVLILEVGLGGRLDAVNAVDADLAIVTSIDLDHCEFLGPDRESIGHEKAGVMRPGLPALCNDPDPPPSVRAHAHGIGARLECQGPDYRAVAVPVGASWRYEDADGALNLPLPALPGAVQWRNAAGAVRAVRRLADRLPVSAAAIADGLRAVRLAGRFDCRGHAPQWVLDVGHNPQAGRTLSQNLTDHPVRGATHAVLALLADKDAAGFVAPLVPHVARWELAGLDGTRGRSGSTLAATLPPGLAVRVHADVAGACAAAARDAPARIVVCGSFHTVEEALRSGLVPAPREPAGGVGGL